jgi:hypothetical protein
MINPTLSDIGRRVNYVRVETTRLDNGPWQRRVIKEEGIISSFNDEYVFVK